MAQDACLMMVEKATGLNPLLFPNGKTGLEDATESRKDCFAFSALESEPPK